VGSIADRAKPKIGEYPKMTSLSLEEEIDKIASDLVKYCCMVMVSRQSAITI
jgi:hypothetical protein